MNMAQNQEENNNAGGEVDQTGNMYCYNDKDSNSMNEPPKESNAIRRTGGGDNPYNFNHINNVINNNDDQNIEQNAIRRSLGDKNPNSDFPNYQEKSSEQRIPNLQESSSPFKMNHESFPFNQTNFNPPQVREEKKFYLITYILIGILQIILIAIIGTAYEWGFGAKNKADEYLEKEFSYYYHFFKDVHLMIFIGFGLLYTALKDHQWSSIGIVLFIGIISFEMSFMWNYLWYNAFYNSNKGKEDEGWCRLPLNFDQLITIDYISAPVLISLGALIGKLSMGQMLIISIFEPFFSSLNYYLCYVSVKAIDNGGSLYIHFFGAIFGITLSIVCFCNHQENFKIINNPHLSSDYYSNIISFIGSLFLWLYFPSFNTANIQYKGNEKNDTFIDIMRYRGIINTYLSMIGSVIGTFVVCPILYKGKIKIDYLINASYVGGIIIGGCCTFCSSAWGAILIGFIGGCLSVLGLWFLKKYFKEKKLDDTFGILFTFGIPGFLGGILNSIFMGISWGGRKNKDFYFDERSSSKQGGIQIGAIFITLCFSLISGITLGFIVKLMKCDINEIYFVDSELFIENELIPFPEWKYPRNNENLNSSGNKIEPQEREVNIEQQQ